MNATDLQNAFHKLPPLTPETKWDEHRLALRKNVARDNIVRFIRWPVINATMFVGEAPYTEERLGRLLSSDFSWGAALLESNVGDPPRLSYCERTSGNKVNQCYHLLQLIQRAEVDPSGLRSVLEFGGGYGAMCHIFHRLGFKGTYSLVDFPEFLLLQEYYLSQHQIEAEYLTEPSPLSIDLFIALFSIGEIPPDVREMYLDAISAKFYLFSYHPTWVGVDNIQWFRELQDRLTSYDWWDFEAEDRNVSRYLVGFKRT